MDILYIPQLDEVPTGGETAATRYRLVTKVPEGGVVGLADKAVNRIEVTASDPLRLVVPPLVEGQVRDFFVRLVVLADTPPELTLAAPTGETIRLEDEETSTLVCTIGANVFSFTETDEGVFFATRKVAEVSHTVAFDVRGGLPIASTTMTFTLGGYFANLPVTAKAGHLFKGWRTAPDGGGVPVTNGDVVKHSVTTLYATWEAYADPYGPAICPANNLMFTSSGAKVWTAVTAAYHTAPKSARSGAITHNQTSSLFTTLPTAGKLAFWYKLSTDMGGDYLSVIVDGTKLIAWAGTANWTQYELNLGAGSHTVEWRYEKNASVSSGSDCVWIDDVVWTPQGGS